MIHQESIIKDSDDLIEEVIYDNLLNNDNPIHIDNDINIDTKKKSNLDQVTTGDNLHKKNSKMNIKDLFQ